MGKVNRVLSAIADTNEKKKLSNSEIDGAITACNYLRTTEIKVNQVEHEFASHSHSFKALAAAGYGKRFSNIEKLAQQLQNEIKVACIEVSNELAALQNKTNN